MDFSGARLAINLELEMMLAMTKVLASSDRSPEMVAAAAQQVPIRNASTALHSMKSSRKHATHSPLARKTVMLSSSVKHGLCQSLLWLEKDPCPL